MAFKEFSAKDKEKDIALVFIKKSYEGNFYKILLFNN
jgi:hypothetical protein